MHALSKKLYYDVMKSGQEDTIIESDSENDCYEYQHSPKCNKEVGCFVRAHMKSNAIQTQLIRNYKNFRHDSTNTNELDKEMKLLKSPLSRILSIHRSISCEDLSISRVHGVQTSSSLELTPTPIRCYNKGVDLYGVRVYSNKSGHSTRHADKCSTAECEQSDKCEETCHCKFCHVPRNRGLAACRTFTLGTLQFRRSQRENRKTKMIGGCHVPVQRVRV
ncbi:uncharacterized protein LOC113495767 [Trichoplusia ni]|uniref:Uncharacterized protein LOC113495767 n=1 Tax=Trichoplusia ni TaxID=7111 RepID=A0A7E5VQB4_TRINI|nr:uncharacterized protein LOC113495767 [Trichoplusia ni]